LTSFEKSFFINDGAHPSVFNYGFQKDATRLVELLLKDDTLVRGYQANDASVWSTAY
jgi:hypothetical protein